MEQNMTGKKLAMIIREFKELGMEQLNITEEEYNKIHGIKDTVITRGDKLKLK